MNFYVGSSINDLDLNDENIEFSDELIEYIYQNKTKLNFDVSSLSQIDPYADVLINNDEVENILIVCNNLLKADVLKKYEDIDEAKDSLTGLTYLCRLALSNNLSLISIGDYVKSVIE